MRLGDLLVDAGVITATQLRDALAIQAQHKGVRLGQILVDHRLVPEHAVVDALARLSGLERLDLAHAEIDHSAAQVVSGAWASEHGIAPITVDRQKRILYVAVADPTDVKPLDELSFQTGYRVAPRLGSEREINHLVRHLFFGGELQRDIGNRRSEARAGSKLELFHGISAAREHVQLDGSVGRRGRTISTRDIAPASEIIPMTGEARVQRPQADEVDVDPVTGKKEERPRERKRPTFTGSLPPPDTRSGVAGSWSPATGTGVTSAPPRASGAPTWPGPPSSPGTSAPWSGASAAPWSSAPPPPPPYAQEAQLIQELTQRVRAMIQLQQQSALELQAVFESCVARGLVERTQYLDRMAQLDPANAPASGPASAPTNAPAGPRPALPPMPPPGSWR